MIRTCFSILSACILLSSCDNLLQERKDSNTIAEAYGHKLYQEDIDPYLQDAESQLDSQFITSRLVDDWLMDIMIYEETKSRINDRTTINKLVEDYEQSLIINTWERDVVNNYLDTLIAREEIDSFFINHKEDFLLEEPILRLLFIKLGDDYDLDTLDELWKTEDLPALRQFCTQNNAQCLLDPSEWYDRSTLKSIIPVDLFAKVSLKRADSYAFTENDKEFYLKILEVIDDKDEIPVEFVQERIKLRILQDRRKLLIRSQKAQLFNEKIKSKKIKIYGKAQ